MKLVILLTAASIVFDVRSSPVPCLNTTNPFHLHHRDINDPVFDPFSTAVCRGIRLSWTMQLPEREASQFLTPITSAFDGDLRDALYHWGYTEVPVQGYLCDFDTTHHLQTAFHDLGLDPRSERRGGPNHCFHVEHRYLDHPLPVREQFYWADDKRYRMTGAHATIGINPSSGIVFFLNRRSALKAVQMFWDTRIPPGDELPALRSTSDIAWGFYNRVKWGGGLGDIRAFMSLMVVNAETLRVIETVLGMHGVGGVQAWPGTTFGVDGVEGQALLGSTNGLAAGFFLAQHKRQIGGNRVVSKVSVFRSEQDGALPNLLFWVA